MKRLPHDESKAWSKKQFPWQDVDELPEQIRDRLNMALLFLSKLEAHAERQAVAMERIADAMGAPRPAAREEPVEAPREEPDRGMERFFVEPKRRAPRRPRRKRSSERKPGPCPTHGELLDNSMMCVDCYKELNEWKRANR